MIKEQIEIDLHNAIKERDSIAVDALRSLKSEFIKLDKSGKSVNESDYISVIKRSLKQREESASIYKTSNRNDLADKELVEFNVIKKYLPEQLTVEQVTDIVNGKISLNGYKPSDFGKLMKELSTELSGKFDNSVLSKIIKENLV